MVYFDTSCWNRLCSYPDSRTLVERIHLKGQIVLSSVISVGEVLRAPEDKRRVMCSMMSRLHGQGPLLERPHDLARAAAEAVRRGEKDLPLPLTGTGNYLLGCVRDPATPPTEEIERWLSTIERNMKRFIEETRPYNPDVTTSYLSQETLDSETFLSLLCKCPPFEDLTFSASEMRGFCGKSDVWRAFAATLECAIKLWATHAPRNVKGKKRPGGADLWQAVYLGVVEVLVSSDTAMRDAVSQINSLLRYPRRILSLEEFVAGLE